MHLLISKVKKEEDEGRMSSLCTEWLVEEDESPKKLHTVIIQL